MLLPEQERTGRQMTNNKIQPAHIIRVYTLNLLRQSLNLADVNGYEPILAIQDEPRVADSGQTYLIYGFSDVEGGRVSEVRRGSVSFRIISSSIAELGEITTTISRAFDLEDRSARAVNEWSGQYQNGIFRGIRFTSIKSSYIDTPEPDEKEGGPVEGIIMVTYSYVTEQEAKQYDLRSNSWMTPSEIENRNRQISAP